MLDSVASKLALNAEAMSILNDMRLKDQLCDAVIGTEDGSKFRVHRAIMATCSPYFRSLFTTGLNPRKRKSFVIPGISSAMMTLIVEYAYTRITYVSSHNVAELLPAADQFNVVGMVNDCCCYLLDHMDISNCIGIWQFASSYFCPFMEIDAKRFVLMNFTQLVGNSDELMELQVEMLTGILASDELNVANEDLVWEAIVCWIDHNPHERTQYLPELLGCVRLALLTPQYFIKNVKNNPYILDNPGCRSVIIKGILTINDILYGSPDEEVVGERMSPLARPRIPYCVMFAIGGWSGDGPTSAVEIYDIRADAWLTMHHVDPTGPRAYHKCAVIGWNVYVIGGTDGVDCLNSCRCFNAIGKKWKEIAPMNTRRCYLSLAMLGETIYAIGGYDGLQRLQTAEKYDFVTNQWTMVAPMSHQRSDASASVLNSRIYVTGGFNGNEYLNSVEFYDEKYDLWTMVAPMRNRRSGVSCITYDGSLYVVGGFNGVDRLETGEKFSPYTNCWTYIADMCNKRSNFAIQVIEDTIFVVGGFNGSTTVNEVESYDVTKDEWMEMVGMETLRSAVATCILSGLPNVRDYVHTDRDILGENRKLRMRKRKGKKCRTRKPKRDFTTDISDSVAQMSQLSARNYSSL